MIQKVYDDFLALKHPNYQKAKEIVKQDVSLQAGNLDFTEYQESELVRFYNLHKVRFNMNKLETVYDNETDEEQIVECKKMLDKELFDVINYFVKDDPLEFFENLT